MSFRRSFLLALVPSALVGILQTPPASANCECGYQTGPNEAWENVIAVNDLAAYNFALHPDFVASSGPGWPDPAVKFDPRNIVTAFGSLNLLVRGSYDGALFNATSISCSEIATARSDILYGSFRSEIKATWVSGTVGTFQSGGAEIHLYSTMSEFAGLGRGGEVGGHAFTLHSACLLTIGAERQNTCKPLPRAMRPSRRIGLTLHPLDSAFSSATPRSKWHRLKPTPTRFALRTGRQPTQA